MTVWTKRRGSTTTVFSKRRSSNVFLPHTWTTATRPTEYTVGEGNLDGYTGYNSDYKGLETYVENTGLWRVMFGEWTVAGRPATASLDVGSKGYNSELNCEEMWNGTEWVAL